MNSEELEVSLRTEFEQHLSGIREQMKQQVADFQNKIESEFLKHKSQIDEAFGDFSSRLESYGGFDPILQESVVEHLRLARDNGAQLAASASAEAEKLGLECSVSSTSFDQIRNAVSDISSQSSQAAILRSLVEHAASFARRGVFFIVKNDSFVGWQLFGSHADADDSSARAISFAVTADSLLGTSVRSLTTQLGSYGHHAADSKFLKPLNLGKPGQMVAIPLIARGRGVAVLYADAGDKASDVNVEALETLVRTAGLTVELHAASQTIRTQTESASVSTATAVADAKTPPAPAVVEDAPEESVGDEGFEPADTTASIAAEETVDPSPAEFYAADVADEVIAVEVEESIDDESYLMTEPIEEPVSEPIDELVYAEEISPSVTDAPPGTEFAFSNEPEHVAEDESVQVEYDDGFGSANGNGIPETVSVAEPAERTSLPRSDKGRSVDLPIEVSDDEREDHTRARRFARLLISEIKLYNEKQVTEGRAANDLYDRLREAVDRSREMYNKRVQPPVASKFDYFHYELVNSLADGDEARLGSSYPGSGR